MKWGYEYNPVTMFSGVGVLVLALWSCQWMAGLIGLATSMSVSRWFFTRRKGEQSLTGNLALDYFTALKSHAGTVAYGSLVHTFTDGPHRFLSVLERFATSKASEGHTGLDRSFGNAVVCVMDWVTLPCVEKCLKYASGNAYASVAMFGTGYWESAKFSFYLVTRNVHRLGATVSVAQLIPFIGKVSTCALCTGAFYMMQVVVFSNQAISIVSATVVAAITSWLIAAQFMAPLSQASTTLLQCYMLDEELFLHNANERFAEKEMHAWVATYGGDFSAVQPS
mmetsp:Transcript_51681/g.88660  ORF Transcript_51681/g.88660 Transcript_51681/m.88660 type:complete len:281 (-) Transcript_51681:100-942(-)